jgi:hypothetical protein
MMPDELNSSNQIKSSMKYEQVLAYKTEQHLKQHFIG